AKTRGTDEGFDYREIDDVIHGRVRLSVMAYLSGAGVADFTLLRKKVGVTDGNLSVHIRKLEDAGYIRVEKKFLNRRPQTLCHLTRKGRESWIAYIARMEELMRPKAAE
ncbi:MAG: transcriptional regulator, partial [Marinicaulis sp.]|nr:transcriptional regulator [Marinicaulis sp.]